MTCVVIGLITMIFTSFSIVMATKLLKVDFFKIFNVYSICVIKFLNCVCVFICEN